MYQLKVNFKSIQHTTDLIAITLMHYDGTVTTPFNYTEMDSFCSI